MKANYCYAISVIVVFLFILSFAAKAQIQLGTDIDGLSPTDNAGWSVSISSDGTRIAVSSIGASGFPPGPLSGIVRVYEWTGAGWAIVGLPIPGELVVDRSGFSISLSSDGKRIAIGTQLNDNPVGINAGHVRVFEEIAGTWIQVGADIDASVYIETFGIAVSLSGDGNRLLVGAPANSAVAPSAGAARVFAWDGFSWVQMGVDVTGDAMDDDFGLKLNISRDGNRIAVGGILNDAGGSNSGNAKMFEWSGAAWVQMGSALNGLAADDRFGYGMAFSSDGSMVAISAIGNDDNGSNSGQVTVYQWNGTSWQALGMPISGEDVDDQSGYFLDMSGNGRRIAIGANQNDGNGSNSGHVRIYDWNGADWLLAQNDIDGETTGDFSGFSLELSEDGEQIVIGAPFNQALLALGAPGHARTYQLSPISNLLTPIPSITEWGLIFFLLLILSTAMATIVAYVKPYIVKD